MTTQLADIKKPSMQGKQDGLINNNLGANYIKTPSQREIIQSYYFSNQFFRQAEARKNKEAIWYFNQSKVMEYKANLALNWRDHFASQASEYLELMVMVRGANHA